MRRKITFLRHGKADKHENDLLRPLSETGTQQATDRRIALGSPSFDLVFASPATRTIRTAAIVSGVPDDAVFTIPAMYPDPTEGDGKIIDQLFNKLLYVPLSVYLMEPNGEVMVRYGDAVWELIKNQIGSNTSGSFLVVGHAVLTPAIAVTACNELDNVCEELRSLDMGECHGFHIEFDDWRPISVATL